MKRLIKHRIILSCMVVSLLLTNTVFANEIYTGFFSDKAISGYDTVAYFTEGKPVKGDSKYTLEYLGAIWYFSSSQNKSLFEAEPDKYRPQYGGHCAWAVAVNKAKAPGNVKYWKIVDDKLYLNYNADVQKKWSEDIPAFIAQSDKVWYEISANENH